MSSSYVRAGEDTWVWGAAGKTRKPFPKTPYLHVANGTREALIRLKSPAPRGATILEAKLILTQADEFVTAGSYTVTVQRTTSNPNLQTLAWARKPASGGVTGSMTKTSPLGRTVWEIPVTAIMQAISDGQPGNLFRIVSSNPNVLRFRSMQSSRFRPYLWVRWTTAPETPTLLKPAYGAVASAKPIVSCDYTDHSGSTDLVAMQVQIDPDNDFAVAAWDSGAVPVVVPEIDLSTTSYPGLSSGSFTYWRCRVKDGDGLWSGWSDSVQMIRYAKGTVTILNPAPAPNDFVSEFTPPILWDFDADQTHFRVTVAAVDDLKRILHDSGKVLGDDEAYTLPGRVLKDGVRYRVTVQAWDTVEREATSGDPVYAQASAEFTVDYDPTIDPVTSLEAEQPALPGGQSRPWVDLVFTRATAPDSWTIMRDGVAIATDLEAGDLIELDEDGITYRFRDFTARPEVAHVYRVRPEVNGKLAHGGPSITFTPSCVGIWLVDPDRTGQQVLLGGRGVDEYEQPDNAETYTVMGSVDVVRSVMGLAGLSGRIDGATLRDRNGLKWAQMEKTLYAWKGRPADELRLVMNDLNIPVVIGDLLIRPSPDSMTGRVIKQVSFAWWQTDEHPFEVNF